MTITRANLNFEREPLAHPFGFKGGSISRLWQTVVLLEDEAGCQGLGLGVQSVLWSEPRVFVKYVEAAANALMLALTGEAVRLVRQEGFTHPASLLDRLLPDILEYGRTLTGLPDLSATFALNALVPLDFAAWMLYAKVTGAAGFDGLIPEAARPALSHRNARVASVPVIGYGVPVEDIVRLVERGYYVLKVKIGSDPAGDGELDRMLAWDIERMRAIHEAVGPLDAPGGPGGRVCYYLDANQRYDGMDRLRRLLDALDRMGALERVLVLEEPFPESSEADVSGLPVRVAADESAHTARNAVERMDQGYGAIALKPIAKTLSEAFRIGGAAHARGVPCFCADLTVNPVLVDWNMEVAARLAPFPGLGSGMLEVNGWQNYARWEEMKSWRPVPDSPWSDHVDGAYRLDDSFFSGPTAVLEIPEHYRLLVDR